MPACELVIFDCDGTLMDSETIAAEVETEALAEYGSQMTAEEFNQRFAGTSSEKFKEVMEEELGRALPDDHVPKVRAKLNERLWQEVKPVAGASKMLDLFDQSRCVCSNAPMEKLKIELTRGELWDRFRPYIFSASDLGLAKKPAPDVFLHAAKEFDADPAACAVLEDSVPGVTAARAAGMRAIGFTGGTHSYPDHANALTDAGAETVVNRLTDVPQVIGALAMWQGLEG